MIPKDDPIKDLFDTLCDFQAEATPSTFHDVFGNVHAQHIWEKFVVYKHNILFLYATLDQKNRELLRNHISTM